MRPGRARRARVAPKGETPSPPLHLNVVQIWAVATDRLSKDGPPTICVNSTDGRSSARLVRTPAMLHLGIIVSFAFGMPADADPKAKELLERYYSAWSSVQSMTYKFKKYERMCDGKIEQALLSVKYKKPG